MAFCSQLKLLLHKNCLLKKKSKCGICCDIAFPIIITGLLIALLSLLSIIKLNYDLSPIMPFEAFLTQNGTTVLYGPTPLDAQSNLVFQSVKTTIATRANIPLSAVDAIMVGFPTLAAMDAYYANNSATSPYGIWFNNTAMGPASSTTPFTYAIRMDNFRLPGNSDIRADFTTSDSFAQKGFASLQIAIDQAVLQVLGGRNEALAVGSQLFPDPHTEPYQKFRLGRDLMHKNAGAIFITAALFIYSFRLVTELVIEKETKIREGMKMMGMNDSAYFLSWHITSLYIAIPVTLVLWLLYKGLNIIHYANWGIVLLLFLFYLFTLLLIGNIMSLFFDRSKFAGIISYILILGISIAGIFVAKAKISAGAKVVLSLISPFGMQCAIYSMAEKDLDGVDPNPDYFAPESHIVGMLFLDIILYSIILWYLDKVMPGEFGTSEPFYFFLKPSYWRPKRRIYNTINDSESNSHQEDVELIPMDIRNKVTVSIRNLRKEFNTGNGLRVAVDGLFLDMYQDQIHAFLGHNGAGKSTTIGMLTGLLKATGGDALIQGHSIQSDMSSVRSVIGVCMQQDIIWAQLTVKEHLSIYAALKGVPSKSIDKTAEDMAHEVGLGEKVNAPAGTLSGGQKRKLCLGIAFIGQSEVIFLDEVTSGMDPLSRRGVWDFLLKYKQGRTIILTTHFMDEADFLGDRIAIITHGKLRCDGSSLYLKKKFGVGYLLTMSKIGGCQTPSVMSFVQNYIPDAQILSDAGTELSFRLPTSSVERFVPFFKDLDQQKGYLGIGHYGISITTMEEVFLRIGQESSANHGGKQFSLTSNSNQVDEQAARAAISTSSAGRRAGQQLKGLLLKRIRTSYKDLRGFFLSILLPAVIIFGSIIVYKQVKGADLTPTMDPLTLSGGIYPPPYFVPYWSYVDNGTAASAILAKSPFVNQLVHVQTSDFVNYLTENYTNDPGALNFTAINPTTVAYVAMYNVEYPQAIPVMLNLVDDALLRGSPLAANTGISTVYLPFKHVLTIFEKQVENVDTQTILYFIILFLAGYALMAASFAGNVCQERAYNIKRLLYISGCKKHIYWLSNLIWDYAFAAVLLAIVTIILTSVEKRFAAQWGLTLLSQIFYCIGIIPLSYLFSYLFRSHGRATGAIFGILYISSLIFLIATINVRVQAMANDSNGLHRAAEIMDYVFYILSPLYCLGRIMITITEFPGMTPPGKIEITNFWALDACGTALLFLVGHMFVWVGWIFILDLMPELKGRLRNPRGVPAPAPPHDEDSDVSAERLRVRGLPQNTADEVVVIQALHKRFPAKGKNPVKNAVYNTTLGIQRGQTFGLLGMNGAGKTTTLSMLSGDIFPTSGAATINGHDLITDRSKALHSIGSCPQFDALIPLLSAREQLYLYSRIKGIPEHLISATVEAFISMMDLTGIANSNVGGYSGGNKRKMSLSIAMLGNPSVVFLDEPSTGCDPQVRRFMWNVISELGRNKVIIITTHSMEECEALCQRISIMKDGKFTCLGSNQHIKSKFGSGYSVDIKFKKEYLENGIELVLRALPDAFLLDKHDLIANFELPNPPHNPIQVSAIFNILQTQLHYLMDDYSVSQTSLEQVFLKLTSSTHENRLHTVSEIDPLIIDHQNNNNMF